MYTEIIPIYYVIVKEGGVRACSEDPPRTTSTATAAAAAAENVVAPSTPTKSSKITINPRVNVLAVPATKTEDVIKGGFVHFHGPSGGNKQLHRYFVLRRDFCLYSYTSDKVSETHFLQFFHN
jgi:hypothetical protein